MSSWYRIFWGALIIKIILASVIPLSNDEAYYWVWSHNLQWSYFDHPGGVAWLFYLGHAFEPLRHILDGIDLNGVVRIPAVIIGQISLLAIRSLFGTGLTEKQHTQWLCVVLLSPFFGIGSLVITPDIPLVLMWCVSLWAFKRYLDSASAINAALLGFALGIGFCGKYPIVLFVPIAVLYVFWRREWRLLRPLPLFVAILTGLVFSAPVWGWNALHDWISFRFQLSHGLDQEAKSPIQMLTQFSEYAGAQLALLSPLVIFTIHKFAEPEKFRFLRWFGWGPILFFAWTSLRSPVEANWPIAGHLPLLVLASIADSKRWLSRGMMTIWGLASVIVVYQALHPAQDLFGIPAHKLKTHEFIRFQPLEAEAEADRGLYASSYQMAGALSIATGRTVGKLAGINRTDFFDYHASGHPQGHGFTVAISDNWPWPSWIKERGFYESSRRTVDGFTLVTFKRDLIPRSHR